jgi:hypothetical protein
MKRDLSDELRYQLTQVLEGYIGRFDEGAARADVALGLFMTRSGHRLSPQQALRSALAAVSA